MELVSCNLTFIPFFCLEPRFLRTLAPMAYFLIFTVKDLLAKIKKSSIQFSLSMGNSS